MFRLLLLICGLLTASGTMFSAQANQEPEIHIFIHACTLGTWDEILEHQLARIKKSGLYDACRTLNIGVLGTGDIKPFMTRYPKINVLFQHSKVKQYERPTLNALHKFCGGQLNPTQVLYLHTKGVTQGGNLNVSDWSNYMEYFAIDRWQDCVTALQTHDVCGVNWIESTDPHVPNHFSGNFWWATARYVSSLPRYIGLGYWDPEFWIGQNGPKVRCFHNSGINHYHGRYPESAYIRP